VKAEIKSAWLEALRSGEYEQGTRTLKSTPDGGAKFCCLGVLCDLHAKATGTEWSAPTSSGDWWRYMQQGADLPLQVQEWAGLDRTNPRVWYIDGWACLSDLNDGCNGPALPFVQIAEKIADKLECETRFESGIACAPESEAQS
jgi:hypothetical protein